MGEEALLWTLVGEEALLWTLVGEKALFAVPHINVIYYFQINNIELEDWIESGLNIVICE